MSAECICDGCGRRAPMSNWNGSWHKPHDWFERTPKGEDQTITACSRPCIDTVEERRKAGGKDSTTVVVPL